MEYRREIDGLRAVAVLPVILFHAGFSAFSGGYVGVDVFFVISGYLITSILLHDLEKGTFSIVRFYERRARRILPALFFVMLCCLPFAWLWMLPQQFKDFSQALVAISLFASNILFWIKTGYFSPAAEENPLLHTWSLAVEEQFYLFFPILLLFLWRFGRRPVQVTILVLVCFSLLLSEWGWRHQPAANFYLLPSRAWELGVGALCALWLGQHARPASSLLSALGLGLILYAIFAYDAAVPFPSLYALAPVGGTALIILFGATSTFVGRLLALKPLVGLGLISFSAYLWHQPLLAFARIRSLENPSWQVMGLLCGVALGLAYLTWRYVENPFRKGEVALASTRGRVFAASLVGTALFFTSGLYGHMRQGAPERLPAQAVLLADESRNVNPRRSECHVEGSTPVPECTYGGEVLGAIVIGDSHAATLVRTIEQAMEDERRHVLDWTLASCPTIAGIRSDKPSLAHCGDFIDYALDKSRTLDREAPLFIINRVSSYLHGPSEQYRSDEVSDPDYYLSSPYSLRDADFLDEMAQGFVETACEFARYRKVYMFRPIPELNRHVPESMASSLIFNGQVQRVSITEEAYRQRHRLALNLQDKAASDCGVRIIDPVPILCREGQCWGDIDGQPVYYDDDHLSETGARFLVPAIKQAMQRDTGSMPLSSRGE
ncbi:MAG: acyltransferase family protein [Pseudomonadota bacterium]